MYSRSYEYLKEKLAKENNAKAKELLQKFLEGVACRGLELEPETPPKTETHFTRIVWNDPSNNNDCSCAEVLKSFEVNSDS
jgi:hypothetical protein